MTTEMPRAPEDAPDTTRPVPRAGTEPTEQVPVVVPRRLGGYQLAERVGEGGMGVVWRAEDDHGRVVAIKVLRPHIAHDEQARERLRREVRTLARVQHPRVASVIDADVDGPAPYIVTDFVDGSPLDEVVARRGPLGREALVRVARGLAGALRAIHERGIVHRDLKPGNVLLTGAGDDVEPVVIDFGIAQVADDVRLTSTGLVMGTPGYLSPELVEGAAVSEATDWWGWAATLAYAASGQPPFGRGPLTVVLDRVARGRLQLEGVDARLRPLLSAALDPDPSRRPGERQVLDALERYARDEDVTTALPAWFAENARPPADPTRAHGVVDPTRNAPRREVHPTQQTPAWREPRPIPPHGRENDPSPPQGGQPAHFPPQGLVPDQGTVHPPHQPHPGRAGASVPQPGEQYGPDPRIGRSARTGTLAALLLLFVSIASVAPMAAWAGYALWGVAARTVDRSLTGLVLRRHEAGRRRSDVPVAVLASPWHLLSATLATLLSLLLPLAVGFIVALAVAGFVTSTELLAGVGPEHPIAVGAGSAVGGWLGWWGLGSTSLRRGSRTVVRGVLPRGVPTTIVVALVLAASAGMVLLATQAGDLVSMWPLAPGMRVRDVLPLP